MEVAAFANFIDQSMVSNNHRDVGMVSLIHSLLTMDSKQKNGNPCVYVPHIDGIKDLICLYVDDGLICSSSKSSLNSFLSSLKETFAVTINDPDTHVGMELNRDRQLRLIHIKQSGYINRMVERFGLQHAKTVSSPIDPSVNSRKDRKRRKLIVLTGK